MSYNSRQVKLNHPNKVLSVSVTNISGNSYWEHEAGSGDIWYEGSASKRFYRWEIILTITDQSHGSHLTRDDFKYNGLDVLVGDWIAGQSSGQCLKIVSISSKTTTSVTCIVEDYLRYNTFKSTTGNGIFNTGNATIFTLNENGVPMLDPLPPTVSSTFFAEVVSRFQYLNPQLNYLLNETSHGFVKGDVISVTASGYAKSNAQTADRMIGVVTEAGPGPDNFMILPNNRIIDFDPTIPGTQGEYIYVNNSGDLSNVGTSTNKIAFLNIRSAVPTILTGDQGNPTIIDGNSIIINSETITFTGTGGESDVDEIASQINNVTNNTSVVANVVAFETIISSDAPNTIYGIVGGYVPFSAYFNTGSGNTLVNFTTEGSQYATVSTPEDMAIDINSANIANVTATATATVLTITELNGNSITLSNGNADTGGYNYVGASNTSGLPESTSATGQEKLRLTRNNGGEILIYESTPYFQTETGIFSAHTGNVPLAMNIEQGVRTGGTTVVGTISARDALTPAAGDQAYVTNKGDGEWGLYLYTGSDWEEISNQDSATVDAKTLTTTFTMPAGGFGTSTTTALGNISPGRKIMQITVSVDTVFSGYSGNVLPNIEIGTVSDPDVYCDSPSNDLTELSDYVCTPDFVYSASETQDQTIRARCNHYQSSAGNCTVTLTYV